MNNYNIFSRFEDALVNFNVTLSQSLENYKKLFNNLIQGEDISKAIIEDIYMFAIQQKRLLLHEEQKRISRVLGNSESYFTLSEIKEKAKNKLSIDVLQIGQSCIATYAEIEHYVHAIESYFGAKVDEYRSFFDKIYRGEEKNNFYDIQGKVSTKKQGVLLHTSA